MCQKKIYEMCQSTDVLNSNFIKSYLKEIKFILNFRTIKVAVKFFQRKNHPSIYIIFQVL